MLRLPMVLWTTSAPIPRSRPSTTSSRTVRISFYSLIGGETSTLFLSQEGRSETTHAMNDEKINAVPCARCLHVCLYFMLMLFEVIELFTLLFFLLFTPIFCIVNFSTFWLFVA